MLRREFADLDLRVLQLIPTADENGLFLAGDTVEKVLVKRLKLTEVGLGRGNAKYIQIRKNYRNSRQILKAASKLANTYGKLAGNHGEEIEVLDPELAVRETTKPTALLTNHQIKKAWEVARECVSDGKSQAWTIFLGFGMLAENAFSHSKVIYSISINCWADIGLPSGCQKVVIIVIMCWMVR